MNLSDLLAEKVRQQEAYYKSVQSSSKVDKHSSAQRHGFFGKSVRMNKANVRIRFGA